MMPVTRFAGVTSKAGFLTLISTGAVLRSPKAVTSSGARSSIIISAPVGVFRSIVEAGQAT